MTGSIGPSTPASTKSQRIDLAGSQPASFRYNNPGAQYPSERAARFGQIGYGIIGGGHLIARFTSPVNGAAANFDLLFHSYVGKKIGPAGAKWTGDLSFGVDGYDPDAPLTAEMIKDPARAIPFLKAIAHRESGRGNNLTEQEWREAHAMFRAGSADAYLAARPAAPVVPAAAAVPKTGASLLARARRYIGAAYAHDVVPKDDADWKGPFDCAEFLTWLVYQETDELIGCVDNDAPPAKADAYTGAWRADMERRGLRVSVEEAAGTEGGILLRFPPGDDEMGHIVLCDGRGGTVEAKGKRYGVVADTVHGRPWDAGILLKGIITYAPSTPLAIQPAPLLYRVGMPNMDKGVVIAIQAALLAAGFNPGTIDGDFGTDTAKAVSAFQKAEGLTVDGIVGPETAGALGVSLQPAAAGTAQTAVPDAKIPTLDSEGDVTRPDLDAGQLLQSLLALLEQLVTDKAISKESAGMLKAVLPALLDGRLSGKAPDPGMLVALLSQFASARPSPVGTGNAAAESKHDTPDVMLALLSALFKAGFPDSEITRRLGDIVTRMTPVILPDNSAATNKLTPVNAALGPFIGRLLDGRKSGLGLVGALLSALFLPAQGSAGSVAEMLSPLAALLPAALGTTLTSLSPVTLPIFLALLIWGFMGKMDKYARATNINATGAKIGL